VRSAYFSGLAAREEAVTQGDAVETLHGYLSLLRWLEDRGMVTHDRVLRAKLALRAAESARRNADSTLESERRELEILTGTGVAWTILAHQIDCQCLRTQMYCALAFGLEVLC
jgi:outer membrane protein TolC